MNTIKTLALTLLIVVATAINAFAERSLIDQMLSPSVQISNGITVGSGTAVKTDPYLGTYIVTNWHVMSSDKNGMKVKFYGEEEAYPAYIHSIDVQNDIAIIITPHIHHTVAKIGRTPSVFDEVYCVGSPYGMPTAPSKGIVTGVDVKYFGTRFFTRTDCNVAPGNSGGGMFAKQNGEWKYVGMPTVVFAVNTGMRTVPITFLGAAVRLEEITLHLYKHGVLRTAPITREISVQ